MTWGTLLGAITGNICAHYKNAAFPHARRNCMFFGGSLSSLLLIDLLSRFEGAANFPALAAQTATMSGPDKLRWFFLMCLGSTALQWSLALLLFGSKMPRRGELKS